MNFGEPASFLRLLVLACLSSLIVACGQGSGEESVDAGADEIAASRQVLVFRDDFGGPAVNAKGIALRGTVAPEPLSPGNWVAETGYGANGWGNDEWQLYTNSMDNLFSENGSLVIRARCATAPACGKRDGTITSARVVTKDRLSVRNGKIRARIKMPSGLGMWPAFWTLGADIDERPWPDAGEIDIVEMHYFYSDNQTTHFATHWSGPRYSASNRPICASGVGSSLDPAEEENCKTSEKEFSTPLTDGFHIFEVDWNDNRIIGKIDGIAYFEQAIDPSTMEEFLKDHFLLLNVAVGGNLGGPYGPSMSVDDWNDTDQTDMLVDWVEVWETESPRADTLISETDENLPYSRIYNSVEFGGASVSSDLESTGVPALEGSKVLELKYSNSVSPNGGITASFSGAVFRFFQTDLSAFTGFRFSIDHSRFPGFDDIGVEFEDSKGNKVLVRTGNYSPVSVQGNWKTYQIPLAAFAPVDMNDIVAIGFFNPNDIADKLIAGTLYLDDIRFVTEACTPMPDVEFDAVNYNPATSVARVSVSDRCAANKLVKVRVESGSDEIYLGVRLDSAGNGSSIFGLIDPLSICPSSDENSYIALEPPLIASYRNTYTGPSGKRLSYDAFATAGVDSGATGTGLSGSRDYFYATDAAQKLAYIPDAPVANSFNYSVFGSGSTLNGAFADTAFNPVFQVKSGTSYGAEVAQLVMINIRSGFAADAESIEFKIKNGGPNNGIRVEFGQLGVSSALVPVDLADTTRSTPLDDNGWYQVSLPMSAFPDASNFDYFGFISPDPAPASGNPFSFLITDINLKESIEVVPAECEELVSVGGAGDGITPEFLLFSRDPTGAPDDLAIGVDWNPQPFSSGSAFDAAVTSDPDYPRVFAVTTGSGYGAPVGQLALENLPTGFASSYANLQFKARGVDSDLIRVKFLPGGGYVDIDLGSDPNSTDLGAGWFQVSIPLTSFTGVADATALLFENDTAAADYTFYLTDIGFSGTGGGGGGGSSSPGDVFDDVVDSQWEVALAAFDQAIGFSSCVDDDGAGCPSISWSIVAAADMARGDVIDVAYEDTPNFAGMIIGQAPAGLDYSEFAGGNVVFDLNVTNNPGNSSFRMKVDCVGCPTDGGQREQDLGVPGSGWQTFMVPVDDMVNANGGPTAGGLKLDRVTTGLVIFPAFGTTANIAYQIDNIRWEAAGGGGAGSGDQLAVNGDFEAGGGDLSGWTQTPNAGSITAVDDQDSGGTWAVKVSTVPGNGSALSLDGLAAGTVQPGDTVDISFDMCAVTADGGEIAVALLSERGPGEGADRVELDRMANPADVWTRYNYSTTAGVDVDGGVSLQFDVVCGGVGSCVAEAYFDNVSITLGGGPVGGSASGVSCAGPVAPGLTLPIDFEGGPYVFTDFNGGQASVEANPQSGGINVSANVGKMVKFADQVYGGSTLDLGGALNVPSNSVFTMKVWSSREVPVLFKLEGGPAAEVEAIHSGGSAWEELIFDFTGQVTGDHSAITLIFDNGTNGEAATDPGNWTFYFDDIDLGTGGGGGAGDPVGDGNELLTNGDFEASPADKSPWINAGTVATNNYYTVDALAGGNVYDTNLSQVVELINGTEYVLSFRARTSVDRDIVVGIGDSGAPYVAALVSPNPALTTEWQSFSFPLTANNDGGAASRVLFDLGTVASTVDIDDVSLELASAPGVNLLTNGDFEADPADKAPWVNAGAVTTNNYYTVEAFDGGNVYDTNLSQVLELANGTEYVLSFRAKASVGRDIVVGIGDSGAPYVAALVSPNPTLTTEWQRYVFALTANNDGGADSRVLFDLGTVTSTVDIDDVSLQVIDTGGGGGGGGGTGEIAVNGSFESGDFTGWTQYESTPGNQTVNMSTAGDTSSDGSFHLEIDNTTSGTNSLIKQERVGLGVVTPGAAWTVTFDARGSFGTGAVAFAQVFAETAGGNENCAGCGILGGAPLAMNADPTVWTSFSFSGTAGPNTESLTLQLEAVTGGSTLANVFYDNISIVIGP